METGGRETRMDEYYAADAGVEQAIRDIRVKSIAGESLPNSPGQMVVDSRGFAMNGKTVSPISVTYVDDTTFKVLAAASGEAGSGTIITSYVNIANFFTNMLTNAITSPGEVNVGNGSTIVGNIQSPSINWPQNYSFSGDNISDSPTWPPYVGLSDFYLGQATEPGYTYYPSNATITLTNGDNHIGPLYVSGNLTFNDSGVTSNTTKIVLDGVIYATGGVAFPNSKNITVELGNSANDTSYAVYADGQGWGPSAQNANTSSISVPGCNLSGPGTIISQEGIYLEPNITSGGFIFVLSTEGEVNFQPQQTGAFVGSIAGSVDVTMQPNQSIQWSPPPAFLNVPGSGYESENVVQRILTWNTSYYDPSQVTIMTLKLSGGNIGVPYSQELSGIGGSKPYTWYITPGTLPPGLDLVGDAIVGTPIETANVTYPQTYSFQVQVTDAMGHQTTQPLSITIDQLTITTQSLASAWTDIQYKYSNVLQASGGAPPYTWSIYTGEYPAPGLSLDSNGTIEGVPTGPSGNTTCTYRVQDSVGNNVTKDLTIAVYDPPKVTTGNVTCTNVGGNQYTATFTGTLDDFGTAPGVQVSAVFFWSDGAGNGGSIDATTPSQPMTTGHTPIAISATTGPFTRNTTYSCWLEVKAVSSDNAIVYIDGNQEPFTPGK